MSDPLRDPQFPDRPQHPDFWRLSECILQSDGATEDKPVDEILGEVIDFDSLDYMARQRVCAFFQKLFGFDPADTTESLMQSVFFDAFLLGAKYAQRGGHQQ